MLHIVFICTGNICRSPMAEGLTSVSLIYSPLSYRGFVYSDAISWPGVREIFREVRNQSQNCLFLHMNQQGEKGQTIYLKAHTSGAGWKRVFIDFLYFYLGLDNLEYADIILKGFFEVKPIDTNLEVRGTRPWRFALFRINSNVYLDALNLEKLKLQNMLIWFRNLQ